MPRSLNKLRGIAQSIYAAEPYIDRAKRALKIFFLFLEKRAPNDALFHLRELNDPLFSF